MVTITIDGRPFEADPAHNLLEACLSLKFDLPYFCWHPALGSVGACRQCAVKEYRGEADERGRIVMACMTPVSKGMRISIEDAEARRFRAGVIEGMMLNHPHDCPVCDEGGECHLQDMTVMTGHAYRRTRFPKRTFENQFLGPFLNHEMNRCIQCYRCVRFYRDYAGGRDFNAFRLRDLVFFGRTEDGVLENEFSGNLVEVCPTGVFTDKTLKQHYTRKWDLQMAPSVCGHCGLGCNITVGERYGMLRRVVNRYNGEVNGYFICDRGRYGYEFVNSKRRIRKPLLHRGGNTRTTSAALARDTLGEMLKNGLRVIGIGSPRASLEDNFALRALVGSGHFHSGMSDGENRLVRLMLEILHGVPAPAASLHDIECSDAVLVLGEDLTNYAPRMALSLRQAVRRGPIERAAALGIPLWNDYAVRELLQGDKGPLYIATPGATRLDDAATETLRAAPADIARLGFATARALDAEAPAVPGLSAALAGLAARIAEALKNAKRPAVVSGPGCGTEEIIRAAAAVTRALFRAGHPVSLCLTAPECNSFGVGMMGGQPLSEAFRSVTEGRADVVIILQNDLYRRAPVQEVDSFLGRALHVIALDHLANPTTDKAELVLPAAVLAETDGTLVNNEGRAQRLFRAYVPQEDVRGSWQWLQDAMVAAGRRSRQEVWKNTDEVLAALGAALPVLDHARGAAPPAGFRMAGARIPREPHRYSGRTAMLANISVHEPKPPEDLDSPLSFSMEGNPMQPPGALIPFFWSPGWNSIQAVNKFQSEVGGPLAGGDPGALLIEPSHVGANSYSDGTPEAFAPRVGEWLLIPLHHIFGSEELSGQAPAVAELATRPYAALNPDDARGLGVVEGESVEVSVLNVPFQLKVKMAPVLPRGLAGLPLGVPPLIGLTLPTWGKVRKASTLTAETQSTQGKAQ